jgi:GDPmannose 4,6-dehydratase
MAGDCLGAAVGKSAFITGVTGQDGSYLCEYLLSLGYTVHGLIRPSSSAVRFPSSSSLGAGFGSGLLTTTGPVGNPSAGSAISQRHHVPSQAAFPVSKTNQHPRLHLHYGDILDAYSLLRILGQNEIDEVYHLAAQSHVALSFHVQLYTSDVDALGTLRVLQAIQTLNLGRKIRFYNVSRKRKTHTLFARYCRISTS